MRYTEVGSKLKLQAHLHAPKKGTTTGIHKADPKVAPKASGDFTVNAVGDQSTESNPESSGISYEAPNPDQSTENAPDSSGISYDQHPADQSTEYSPDQGQAPGGYAEEEAAPQEETEYQ